jgi:hypothetical protein
VNIADDLIKSNYDIICLQGVYRKKSMEYFRDNLSKKYPEMFTYYEKGLALFCKESFCIIHGLMADLNKKSGYTGVHVIYKGIKLFIVNTYLEKYNRNTLQTLKEQIDRTGYNTVILCGAFNLHEQTYYYNYIVNYFNLKDGYAKHKSNYKYTRKHDRSHRYDYIFVSNNIQNEYVINGVSEDNCDSLSISGYLYP